MTDEYHSDPDDRARPDGLRAAFDEYQPAPPDIVPRNRIEGINELDIDHLAGSTTEVTHYEMTEDGITKTVERVTICKPITNTERNTQ